MDQICCERVAWKSISVRSPPLNDPGKLGKTRQGMAGVSWELSGPQGDSGEGNSLMLPGFPGKTPIFLCFPDLELLLGLSKAPRPALLVPSLCSPRASPTPRLSLGKIQPCPAPSLLDSDLEVIIPSHPGDRTLLLILLPVHTGLSRAPGAALFQQLHPGILPIHCISRAWERFGMPQLIPGNAGAPRAGTWAEHTWSRGGWHVPAGITHAGRENRGRDGSLGLF